MFPQKISDGTRAQFQQSIVSGGPRADTEHDRVQVAEFNFRPNKRITAKQDHLHPLVSPSVTMRGGP